MICASYVTDRNMFLFPDQYKIKPVVLHINCGNAFSKISVQYFEFFLCFLSAFSVCPFFPLQRLTKNCRQIHQDCFIENFITEFSQFCSATVKICLFGGRLRTYHQYRFSEIDYVIFTKTRNVVCTDKIKRKWIR